jgi:hypothetical protein
MNVRKADEVSQQKAVEIVQRFWREVWQQKNPDAADQLVTEDFSITSGGVQIGPRENFKAWVRSFLDSISDLNFEVVEIFQNETGDRVVTRWIVRGKNNGFMGLDPCQSPIYLTGTAIIQIGVDGLLKHNWVERNGLEVYRSLVESQSTRL